MKLVKILLFFFVGILISCGEKENPSFTKEDLVLIPEPKLLEVNKGSFRINRETKLIIPVDSLKPLTNILNDLFEKSAGFKMSVSEESPENNFIQLQEDSELGEEAYKLSATTDRVILEANSRLGFVYGLETIRQLLPKEIESASKISNIDWLIPNVEIKDEPQYSYRGNMLDVSRHFFEKDYIKKHIDRMAFLKLNTLHFHLVDDQGWRIEIKKYPKLTQVGGFRVDQEDKHWNARTENEPEEEATFGGFYTQEDIKEIMAYAREKGIRIIPEIEMPAHVMSAIAAYPWLSCTEEPIAVPSGGVWPITEIYCAGKESTFEFLEDVLTEVMELFPGKYIHVGGDEATKTNWESCPDCQRRIREEGLANEHELQSYFMKRIEKFLNKNGRTLIGWDEILEGGLPEEATVMSWRGFEGGWEASKQGHDVIMTPTSHLYFDYYQGSPDHEPVAFNAFTPLHRVYEFRPVLDSMTVEQKKHVLGGQANLWSEYVPNEEHSEYMLFPRLAALSEVVWTPENKLNWEDFSVRIQKMMERFDIMGINYARSAYAIQPDSEINLETGEITTALKAEFPNVEIRYARGDSELSENSAIYKEPIKIESSSCLKAAVFKNGEIMGPIMDNDFQFHKAAAKPVTYKYPYNDNYKGGEETGLVDVLRGSKYFKDGRWQGWINNPAVITINLEKPTQLSEVVVGSLEEQGTGIYFPQKIKVEISEDGKTFEKVGEITREFQNNSSAKIENFSVEFDTQNNIEFVRVTVEPLENNPKGGGSWLFLDEIQVK
ncbi:glycoside hydrolase family 20 protein [Salegentibacter salegens]|uniref:beta-N-acetylhexosaminidase n=1 Tax=Salegentibacter salegens TaxID=143223 RepID=A0A1M7HPY4_9FLAO|nr:glycoside hydrolase family 20 protein [Salegentibacter salegens]PRX39922.1 hexosaminidase [Salegentibacter salegens]SHM30566.1 hexosaminidase [Salegentibacter salegens]